MEWSFVFFTLSLVLMVPIIAICGMMYVKLITGINKNLITTLGWISYSLFLVSIILFPNITDLVPLLFSIFILVVSGLSTWIIVGTGIEIGKGDLYRLTLRGKESNMFPLIGYTVIYYIVNTVLLLFAMFDFFK